MEKYFVKKGLRDGMEVTIYGALVKVKQSAAQKTHNTNQELNRAGKIHKVTFPGLVRARSEARRKNYAGDTCSAKYKAK